MNVSAIAVLRFRLQPIMSKKDPQKQTLILCRRYCGASSTGGKNIQLDMSETYKQFELGEEFEGKPTVRAGISHSLLEFNAKLGKEGLFVPHGQCSHVHLGWAELFGGTFGGSCKYI